MAANELTEFIRESATARQIPGVAVGVWSGGEEAVACHGVTSVENPLPVDPDTLYVLGSVTKAHTATAVMQLIVAGQVELDAPVHRYVPELRLADEEAALEITVLNLLNHTSGLDWGLIVDTGEGDDALAAYVASLAELPQIAPPGARASYSQAGYNLAGRIVEKVTGLAFEQAVAAHVFEPLRMTHSFFARDDVMTRRFAVGHNLDADGELSVARLWRRSRGDNPGGGIASSVADQLRFARLHLGRGADQSGEGVLPIEALAQMQQPTVRLRGSSLGDAIGIGWFLRDVDGVRTIGHGGSANGQFAELLIVPERDFAVVSLSNAGPDAGLAFNQAAVRWALERYAGVTDIDPEPVPFDPARARELTGDYENEVMTLSIGAAETGLRLGVMIKPELRAAADKEMPPDVPPADLGLLPGDGDDYIITSGGLAGQRGFFTRDDRNRVIGIDLAGRIFHRIPSGRDGHPTLVADQP